MPEKYQHLYDDDMRKLDVLSYDIISGKYIVYNTILQFSILIRVVPYVFDSNPKGNP